MAYEVKLKEWSLIGKPHCQHDVFNRPLSEHSNGDVERQVD